MSHSHKFFTHRDIKLLTDKQIKETRRAAEYASKSGKSTPRKPQSEADRQHAHERLDAILREKVELLRQVETKKAVEQRAEDETKSILAKAREEIAAEKAKDKEAIDAARATYHAAVYSRPRR